LCHLPLGPAILRVLYIGGLVLYIGGLVLYIGGLVLYID
jgi:hypothetical protein